jgi:hypothetical protein
VGAALGGIAAASLVVGSGASATLLGAQLGVLAGPIGAFAGAFLGFIVGGVIGSVFGGTPRAGADVVWDVDKGQYVAANGYARKGGSKETASSLAESAAGSFNSIVGMIGGTLLNPQGVTAGNYGMRGKDYVYRPTSTRDKDAITYRVNMKQKDAAADIIAYDVYQGLTDPDFQIAGGSVYTKRALYNTIEAGIPTTTSTKYASGFGKVLGGVAGVVGGVQSTRYDLTPLFGNLSAAQQYESYLANSGVINAIVSAESDSVFAAETALTLARAVELYEFRGHEFRGHRIPGIPGTGGYSHSALNYHPAAHNPLAM